MNSRHKNYWMFLPLLGLLIVMSGCQGTQAQNQSVEQTLQAAVAQTMTAIPTATVVPTATATSAPTVTSTPADVPIQVGPSNFPATVNPLTGLTVSDPTILNRRPVMVKVANYPRSGRPHAGLSSADIVFDYSTGEGGNRFLALFYGQDSTKVGPIRSGRLIDRFLVTEYQGILRPCFCLAARIRENPGYARLQSGVQ